MERRVFEQKTCSSCWPSAGESEHEVSLEEAEEYHEKVVDVKAFKCEQCGNDFKSENGLKIHIGKAHKNF